MPQRIKKKISHKAIYLSDTEKLKVKGRKKYILVIPYQQEDSILLLPSNETDSKASSIKLKNWYNTNRLMAIKFEI